MVWNLHFEDLIAEYTDTMYMKVIEFSDGTIIPMPEQTTE